MYAHVRLILGCLRRISVFEAGERILAWRVVVAGASDLTRVCALQGSEIVSCYCSIAAMGRIDKAGDGGVTFPQASRLSSLTLNEAIISYEHS